MRTWFSLIAIVAALAYVQPALADTPAAVYSDFAENGVLNCGHSRSALKGVLKDASLYQYGDPLTFLQLKLAIRRQLARGCERRGAVGPGSPASRGTSTPASGGTQSAKREAAKGHAGRAGRSARGSHSEGKRPRLGEVKHGGAMGILGVGLLLLALGSGGWAATRAFTN